MKQPILLLFASALALSACNAQKGNNAGKPGTELGIIPEWMDKTAVPGDDFYAYADGSWQKNTPIPADRSNIGGFYIADQEREKNTVDLFNSIVNSNPSSGTDALIANYYKAYLNTDAIDRAGLAPAKADLDAIAGITNKQQLSAAIGSTLRADTDPLNADKPGNEAKQRQLNDKGKALAREFGDSFRKLGIQVGTLATSKLYRAQETARLMNVAEVTTSWDITEGNQIISPNDNNARAAALRKLASTPPAPGKNNVYVTHKPNVIDAFGIKWTGAPDRTNGHFAPFDWQGEAA